MSRTFWLCLLALLIVMVTIRTLFWRPVFIRSDSMAPTLKSGDVVLLRTRMSCRVGTMDRPCIKTGDIIAFEHPFGRGLIIKRVVATGGDTIRIKGVTVCNNSNKIYQNDLQANLEQSIETRVTFPSQGWAPSNYGPLRVPMTGDTIRVTESNWPQYRSIFTRNGHADGSGPDEVGTFLATEGQGPHLVENSYLFVVGDNISESVDSRYWGYLAADNVIGSVFGPVLSWRPYPRLRWIHRSAMYTQSDMIAFENN